MNRFLARPFGRCLATAAFLLATAMLAGAIESPTSYGEAARVDTPILRVPFMTKPPTIDGVMTEGEWADSASISGFWYDFANADFRFMAPPQTQLQLYAGYDKEHLYFCFTSPVYPENSWLKARGRFPDVLSHPLYGMLWDDHHELEIRPYPDVTKGFQLGLFRWDVNPIGTITDWYWSQQGGHDWKWTSGAVIRSQVDGKRWVVEYSIPLSSFVYGGYDAKDADGKPIVTLPPPDGTIYRAWLVRAIGGNGAFFNAFDNHAWNTTKLQLVFDSQAPSFQVNELGPVMEDTIDVRLTVKNHNTRSETVRLGFFVESAEGLVYSSYNSPDLKDGLLELRPGEDRTLRLQQPFPGISRDGNVLWFDVRTAGKPAKTLYLTRLIRFHSMEGGAVSGHSFMDRRVNVIQSLRPPRKPFDFRSSFSSYTSRRNYPILRMFTETRTWLQEAGELAGSERRAEVAARFVQESPFARFEFLGARSGMLDAAMRDLQTAERLLEDPAADAAVTQRKLDAARSGLSAFLEEIGKAGKGDLQETVRKGVADLAGRLNRVGKAGETDDRRRSLAVADVAKDGNRLLRRLRAEVGAAAPEQMEYAGGPDRIWMQNTRLAAEVSRQRLLGQIGWGRRAFTMGMLEPLEPAPDARRYADAAAWSRFCHRAARSPLSGVVTPPRSEAGGDSVRNPLVKWLLEQVDEAAKETQSEDTLRNYRGITRELIPSLKDFLRY